MINPGLSGLCTHFARRLVSAGAVLPYDAAWEEGTLGDNRIEKQLGDFMAGIKFLEGLVFFWLPSVACGMVSIGAKTFQSWATWIQSNIPLGSRPKRFGMVFLQDLGGVQEVEMVILPAVLDFTADLFSAVQRGDAT